MNGPITPTEFDDVVMWAAWLYYADQKTQSEIAKTLGVSRATIVNLLQEARERGIVSVNISPAAGSRTSLARGLMERYGLRGAFVIPGSDQQHLVERLGDAGARVLADMLVDGDVIGVAWGRTVLAAADRITLPRPLSKLTVVQVSGSSTGESDFSPEFCTSLLSNRIGARCVNLLAPAFLTSRELKAMLLAEPLLQKQMALVHSSDHVLFGIGDIAPQSTVRVSGIATQDEINDYVNRGAVGVIIGRFIDEDGRPLGGDHDERMVGITLNALLNVKNRVCVAGGSTKVAAIRATLKAGFPTHFVTDVETAETLLSG